MHAFLFGDSGNPLYGVYHPPSDYGRMPPKGVLLCPPVGHEYLRSHWAFRMLAEKLAGKGLHCLRFDYYATGDSSGKGGEGLVNQWIGDILTAHEELANLSGSGDNSIIGLRLGGSLAMSAVDRGLSVKDLVLWDPVVTGGEYIRELKHLHKQRLLQLKGYAGYWMGLKSMSHEEFMGFPFPETLQSGIRNIDLTKAGCSHAEKIYWIRSEKKSSSGPYRKTLENNAKAVEIIDAYQQPGNWSSHDDAGEAVFALEIIQKIVHSLTI